MNTEASVKNLILTEMEAEQIRSRVEDLRASLYKTDFKLEDYIDKNFTSEQKDLLLKEIQLGSDLNALQKSLDEVIRSIADMELLLIRIPFEPTIEFTEWVKEFLLQKIQGGVNLVVRFDIDKSLLAGVLLEFKGKIQNSSAKNRIEEIFTANY